MKLPSLALLSATTLAAQCVMCNRTAAAQNLARSGVFNKGILVLLVPPILILAALAWFALWFVPRRSRYS